MLLLKPRHSDYQVRLTQTNVLWLFGVFFVSGLISFLYPSAIQFSNGQIQVPDWNRYEDPSKKFTFLYPPDWTINSTRNDDNGYTEVILANPKSIRMKASIMFIPNDPLLVSNTGNPVVMSRALTNLEEDMSSGGDYFTFNSTGKFPHKYIIQGHESASDVIDYEKIEGKPGKMLIVYAKLTEKDSIVFSYAESKRTFYNTLSNASQIIKSLTILNS